MLSLERAEELFEAMKTCRVAVVGDLMLDRYIQGTVDRISPEAPVPVVHVRTERSVPGGACNVALNVCALGGQSVVCGVVGKDAKAEELLGHLQVAGVDTSGVLAHEAVTTIVKERVLAGRQQVVRIDYEVPGMHEPEVTAAFLEQLDESLVRADGAVLEDYGKGCLEQDVVDVVMNWRRDHGKPVGLDPKDNHELDVRGITFATPNRKEAFTMAKLVDATPDIAPLSNQPLLAAAQTLRDLWNPEYLMITLGAEGMLLTVEDEFTQVPTRAREVFDVSGAGDTVIATIMLALTAGATFREAAELGNIAAGLVVAKIGTAITSPEEILNELRVQA